MLKRKIYLGFQSPLVDDRIFGGSAPLPPNRPSDRLQQRGFASPVRSADAGHVQPPKIERGSLVTEKIAEGKLPRNHGNEANGYLYGSSTLDP